MSAAPSTSAMASPVMPRFYSATPLSRNTLKKTRAIARVFAVTSLAACLDHPVDDLHLVAGTPARRRGLGEQALGAVLVTDDDLVFHGLFRVLLDLVSGKAAAERAKDGRDVLASAAAHLVTEHSAHYRASDRSGARPGAGFLNLAHFLDHGALAADRGHDDRGRRRNRCISGLAWRRGSRDRFRPGRRLGLGGLCLFGLRCGLLGRLGNGRARGARVPDRGRDPAENGSDSHEAEQRDRDRGDDEEWMGLTCGLRFHEGLLLQGVKLTRNNARGARGLM